jgi:hypothetical protein
MFSRRYIPSQLSRRDRRTQRRELLQSRRLYKQGIYHTRASVPSFRSRPSGHVAAAKEMYGVDTIGATAVLARKTGCTRRSLAKIINNGEGAYYSSGSRPNQTAQSWGVARLASAITAGKAAAVDFSILETGCRPGSKALTLARRARRRYGRGTRRVPRAAAD